MLDIVVKKSLLNATVEQMWAKLLFDMERGQRVVI
jgi:hypothetical protein